MADKFPGKDDPLTETEKHVWGFDAKRHSIVTTMVVEQGVGAHDPDVQAWQYVENLARTDPAAAEMWRKRLKMAAKK